MIDAERRLTPAGCEVVAVNARRLRDRGHKPDTIISSSFRRARETAELVRDTAFGDADLKVDDSLVPSGTYQGVLDLLTAMKVGSDAAEGDILLVSHQPLIGNLAAELTGRLVSVQPGTILGMAFDRPKDLNGHDEDTNGECGEYGEGTECRLTWVIT